jgi:hypothetical protein
MSKHNPIIKHLFHPIKLIDGPFGPHRAKIICKKCKQFVKWATEVEVKELKYERNNRSGI